MYKIISGRNAEQLERLLNRPEVKQVINSWVLNGTIYALIQKEEPKATTKEPVSKPKEPVSKPKATTSKPRKPRKKSTD